MVRCGLVLKCTEGLRNTGSVVCSDVEEQSAVLWRRVLRAVGAGVGQDRQEGGGLLGAGGQVVRWRDQVIRWPGGEFIR